METEKFDIFISHNNRDKDLIEPIVQRLYEEHDVRSWLDKWDLRAAKEWEPAIKEALESCKASAVVLGSNGWGPYHLEEARLALKRRENQPDFKVIPVLLPGAKPEHISVLGDFFGRTHRVDFSNGVDDGEAFRRLLSAIQGDAPGPPPMTVFTINRAARQWEQTPIKEKDSILYRGGELRAAQSIAATFTEMLGSTAVKFLTASAEHEQLSIQIERNRTRKIIAGLIIGLILIAATAVLAFSERERAQANFEEAERQRAEAQKNFEEAENQRAQAQKNFEEAEKQRKQAIQNADEREAQRKEANWQKDIAVKNETTAKKNAAEARRQEGIAQDNEAEARRQQTEAERQTGIARTEEQRAKEATRLANARRLITEAQNERVNHPSRAVALALEAVKLTPTQQAIDELFNAVANNHERRVFRGHNKAVNAVAWAPAGKYEGRLLSVSDDNTGRIWSRDASKSTVLYGHTGPVLSGAWSENGTKVLTTSKDGTARIWDPGGNSVFVLSGHTGPVFGGRWNFDGSRVLTVSRDGTARIWDAVKGTLLAALTGHAGPVRGGYWSPDGERILTVSDDGTGRIWDDNGKLEIVLRGHRGPILQGGFQNYVGAAFTVSLDGTVRTWDPYSGKVTDKFDSGVGIVAGSWNSTGTYFAGVLMDTSARIWSLRNEQTGSFYGFERKDAWARRMLDYASNPYLEGGERVFSMLQAEWSPNGEHIFVADLVGRIWSPDGELRVTLGRDNGGILSAAWGSDSRHFAIGSADGTVRIGVVNNELYPTPYWPGNRMMTAEWSPDGSGLATISKERVGAIWNADGSLRTILKTERELVLCKWSPDGKKLATTSVAGELQIWKSNGELEKTVAAHSAHIYFLEWSPDGTRIFTAAHLDNARLSDADGNLIKVVSDKYVDVRGFVSWSADSKEFVVSHFGDNEVYDRDGNLVLTMPYATAGSWNPRAGKINSKLTSAKEPWLVSAKGNTATVWAGDGKTILAELKGHSEEIKEIAWSPDARFILTVSDDHTARIWNTDGTQGAILQHTVRHGYWSHDSKQILTIGGSGAAYIWDANGNLKLALQTPAGMIASGLWHPVHPRVLTIAEEGITIWPTTLEEIIKLAEDRRTFVFTGEESKRLLDP